MPEDKIPKEQPENKEPDELEVLRKENEQLKAKAEEERRARLSEDEKKAEEEKARHNASVRKLTSLTAKAYGIPDDYADLIKGENEEEIEESAKKVAGLIKKTREETETEVKKLAARTPAPGSGDGTGEQDIEASYLNLIKGGR